MRYGAIVGAILGVILASQAASAAEPDGSLAIRLAKGVSLRNVALAATGSLQLGDRSRVVPRSVKVGTVSNAGTGPSLLGVSSNVGSNMLSVGQVALSNNARIAGSLLTVSAPTTQPGAGVTLGTTLNAQLTPVTAVGWVPPAPGSQAPFTLNPDQTGTLGAGSYGNVSIYSRAKVTLGAGVYEIDSFSIEPQATITFDNRNGPIIIYARSNFSLKGLSVILGAAKDLAVVYSGSNACVVEAPFSGTVVAPYASLRLAAIGTGKFNGQFLAKSLVVDPDVVVTFVPFNWDAIKPFLGAGDSTAPRLPPTTIHGTPFACSQPGITGTLAANNTYSSLKYATPDASAGVCSPTFCSASGQVIASPTEAQLNTAPPAGSTCAAFPSAAGTCPVDPETLSNACTTDADCATGAICASQCADAQCTSVRHLCGKPAETCGTGGLPAQTQCDDLQLCPLPGAVGTPNLPKLQGQLSTTSAPNPSGQIPAGEQDPLPTGYPTVDATVCGADPTNKVETQTDVSNKPADDGSSQWGVYLTPTSGFKISPTKRTDGIAELEVGANIGVAAGGILFGNHVEVISAAIATNITDCGVTLTGAVKLFGEAVVAWTPSAGQAFHLATDDSGGSLATPALASQECKTARESAKNAIKDARESNLLARAAKEYYLQMGLTPELCNEIKFQLPNRVKDANGQPLNCTDLDAISPVDKLNIINAWKSEYDGATGAYADFSTTLGTKHQTIQTSGTIDVFKSPHPFNLQILDQDIPVGPVTLNVAVAGYGSWNIMGGVQFGLGFSGDFSGAGGIIGNALKGDSPNVGDIRVYGGPVITPALQTGVQCFVGVGIPGVSIGLQGNIDLLDISMPSGIVAAAMRVSTPDPRPLTGTDFAGTPLPGLAPADYRWVTGFNWNSKLTLTELSGELDLALRVHFLFFHHTFKMKLFSWPGLTQDFTLISGGTTDIMNYANDYGSQADSVAYTPISPITDNPPKTNSAGSQFPDCSIVVK